MLTLIYFVLILTIVITIHEFGHFIFAKIFGVYVYEFSIGMGPKIFSKKGKNGETEYTIRAIPIGGYVRLAGEEVDDDKEVPKKRKMYSKPAWQRFLIMFFGPANNFLLALILLFTYALIWKAPVMDPIITEVKPGYPAELSGISANDRIVEVNGKKTSTIDDVQLYLSLRKPESKISFKIVDKDGILEEIEVTPVKDSVDGKETYVIGITFDNGTKDGFIEVVKYTFVKIGALMKQMVVVIKSLFTGKLSLKNLSGPVGIYSIVGDTASHGIASVVQLVALLSVNVGVISLITYPAFDGGRIFFLIIEKIKGSPVSTRTENIIHSIGFIILMLLLLYVTFNDILRLF